ncbi:MAG: chemotaxis protein CheW [candidate division KSB1 bacterium]|nr:chemotaxis protein CheW [candidate division KSB1 bacterium]MDQ7065941.1 chemotaxis protein CheW [candidate division KSB1 bacterium]
MLIDNAKVFNQLVAFKLGDEEFGIPIQSVQEIVRPPLVTRVPYAPGFIEGIANLRGDILPILSLRNRLGMPYREIDSNTRIVVLKTKQATTGIIVDSVSEVIRVDQQDIDHSLDADSRSTIDTRFLKSIARLENGKRLVLVLNETSLLPQSQSIERENKIPLGVDKNPSQEQRVSTQEQYEHLVAFWIGNEEYAIDISRVKEIIRANEITAIPDSPAYFLGVIMLRNELIPIMDICKRFECGQFGTMESQSSDSHANLERIIVVDANGSTVGLKVNNVSEVLRINKNDISPPPLTLSKWEQEYVKGIGKLNHGHRLITLLDLKSLLSQDDTKLAQQFNPKKQPDGDQAMVQDSAPNSETQLVCFYIEDEEFAIDIMKVQEIIRIPQITKIPNAPAFIEGIVNLRGNILPVVDVRTRFGLPKKGQSDNNRIVVVNNGKTTTGLIVDSVSEVLRISTDCIDDPPDMIRIGDKIYFEGIANLDNGKRIILLINIESLLSEVKIDSLVPSPEPELVA